jgi:hypothetical protein
MMKKTTGIASVLLLVTGIARAGDYGAKTNGNWISSSTWTPAGVPSLNDNAYIGSTYPGGSAATATVSLTQDQQANAVLLGYGTGTSGTLELGNSKLTANAVYLGFNGGTGIVTRGTGSFDVGALRLSGSTLVMSASDKTRGSLGDGLFLSYGSSVTTAATGNVSNVVRVQSGSTLTLGADLYAGALTNSYTIELSGADSTLDAQFHKITTEDLSIGWEYVNNFRVPGSHVVRFVNRGDLDVKSLFVANQGFDLTATDRVDGFGLSNGSTNLGAAVGIGGLGLSNGSAATTTAVGNITSGVSVQSGSTLTLGADLTVIGGIGVAGNDSTLDAQGHTLTAASLLLGWDGGGTNVRLLNRGKLAVTNLNVSDQDFNLTAADRVTGFALSNGSTGLGAGVTIQSLSLQDGATAATSAVGNITQSVDVTAGSTLTLGADLNVAGSVQVYGDNSTFDAGGHKITADTMRIGVDGGTNVRLLNTAGLDVTTELLAANLNLNLSADDRVANFRLFNGSTHLGPDAVVQQLNLDTATATTSATENIAGSVGVNGSILTLGADLNVSGSVHVSGDNSTLDAQGHNITADTLSLSGTTAQLLNKGDLAVTKLMLAAQNLNLSAADRVVNLDLRWVGTTGSTASTAASANVTGSVGVYYNSTLTLGADLSVSGGVTLGFDNSTLDARGHNITADTLVLGDGGGTNVRLLNRGQLAVTNLNVAGQDFNLTAADRVTNFNLAFGASHLGPGVGVQSLGVYDSATATTTATGNVTASVDVVHYSDPTNGSKLTLGADLILSGHLDALGDTITIDAQGHNITAASVSLTYDPGGDPGAPLTRLLNDGALTVHGALALAGGVLLDLHDGNDSAQSLFLSDNSGLTIKSAATGFTLTGAMADDLLFTGTSTLALELDGSQPGWELRWANLDGSNHIDDLNALIAQDSIVFTVTHGGEYEIVSQNGYTYVVQSVPEPSSFPLIAAPIAAGPLLHRRNRPATRRKP